MPGRLSFATPPDFVFAPTVVSHGWYHLAPFRWSAEKQLLQRTERIGDDVLDLSISFDGNALLVSGRGELATYRTALEPRLRRMFQLDVQLHEFLRLAGASPSHQWVVERGFGRLLCAPTLFEDAVKIIATTNTMWSQTVRMVERLVEKCGRRSNSGHAAFPDPEDVVRFTPDELQTDCRLGYRAKSIHALARGIVEGSIDLAAIARPEQTTPELFRAYQQLPGIGPYGAAHLLAMDGRHDYIAVDTEFRRFVRERYHGGRKVADRTMLRRYAKWGRWQYLAYWSELWGSVADRLQPVLPTHDT
jgi:3-methyladenine DNA glycosylase/8-oxoguanine DNA glycosylase